MDARSAEMALLASATGSEKDLVASDLVVLRKMRHADVQLLPKLKAKRPAADRTVKNRQRGAA
jgi:hypothetical protein